MSWGDFRHTNDRIDEFADAYRQVCQELNVPYISLREAFWEHREKLLPDGLHPNDEGHAMIYGLVKSALEEADLLQIVTKESNKSDG